MTEAQTNALNQIEEIMREHFQSAVIVCEGEVDGSDKHSDIQCTYHGGYAACIGLLELGKLHVFRTGKDASQYE